MNQHHQNNKQQSNFKREWTNVHVVDLEPGDPNSCIECADMRIQIARSNDRFPLYTWELVQIVGAEHGEKKYSRMRVAFTGRRTGKITISPVDQHIAALFRTASDWIHERLQDAEDKWIEFEQDRAKRSDDRSKPKQHAGLKQLSKQDAAKRRQD